MSKKVGHVKRQVIVAGFDGQSSGFDAVALGRTLAETTGARLLVAHVFAYDPVAVPALTFGRRVEDTLREQAREELRKAEPTLAGFDRWEPCALAGPSAARELHELADRTGSGIIVAGATHRHGLGRAMPGPTAVKLLHGAPCSVAIAPAGWSQRPTRTLSQIGAAFDGSTESRAALDAAARLAHAAKATLHIVAVFQPPNPAHPAFAVTSHGYTETVADLRAALIDQLEIAVAALGQRLPVIRVVDGDPVEVLAAESASFDLLTIGSRGYGPLRAALLGSVSAALAARTTCPLLVVPRGVEHPLATVGERAVHAVTADD
jgi:nucleotide-binding universal stress UspA family protein